MVNPWQWGLIFEIATLFFKIYRRTVLRRIGQESYDLISFEFEIRCQEKIALRWSPHPPNISRGYDRYNRGREFLQTSRGTTTYLPPSFMYSINWWRESFCPSLRTTTCLLTFTMSYPSPPPHPEKWFVISVMMMTLLMTNDDYP